ncbi:putative Calcineurin-like phosphoesterase domain-containing protein [Seiridium cardinale]|uniref:Calcineurin-like phosphoesterase domain-containing protein n=1 Tax=Seiridium cardinale TaxID=138064 RepID=A0ABR2XNN1_9PEZI
MAGASYSNANANTHGLPTASSYNRPFSPPPPSVVESILSESQRLINRLRVYWNGKGRVLAWSFAMQAAYRAKANLAARRLLSFPHLLVVLWMLVMLWGERWTFTSQVQSCDWDHWEEWPPEAAPHRLIFVADPQLIDPHSYPGRPWPLNPLTYTITDNYMRRSYKAVQKELRPDTVMFLGDLFDGGREWTTAHGGFEEPEWMRGERPADEAKYVKKWNKKYGEDFWLQEYFRFGDLFYGNWGLGGVFPGSWQRGRKIIASLPGNHDLGFGPGVKPTVRKRFSAYFGDTNRVDVIGNHTFVSVDTLSLSAGTHPKKDGYLNAMKAIYGPVHEFLDEVKAEKRRAAARELKFWNGEMENLHYDHKVEDVSDSAFKNLPSLDQGEKGPDFPTVLLSHVPLWRDPGTPCGPLRERSPPTKPPKGQSTPLNPDHRNALHSVGQGYQYHNALTEEDSIRLIKSVGNVVQAFSGDDHDYCDIVHTERKDNVREITAKSFSMAMGVKLPGFQMVSLYNPIDEKGESLLAEGIPTLQTHLCLLPKQLSTFTTYAALAILTLFILATRAFLVPVLNLQPFALDAISRADSAILPTYNKAKFEAEPEEGYGLQSSGHSTSKFLSARTRERGASITSNGSARGVSPKPKGGKWGWGETSRGPRIEIRRDVYDGGKSRGFQWQASRRPTWRSALQSRTQLIGREFWTTSWRVTWMAVGFYAYLTYKG